MLRSILSAFTLLVTVKLTVDIAFADPDNLNIAAATLVMGSFLAAYVLIIPIPG